MARTDKTRPWHVRMAEDPLRTCRPEHDHRAGVCDLPADPRAVGRRTACRWVETDAMPYGRDHGCGCSMCTGRVWRREERRRARRTAAASGRQAVKFARGGDRGVDLLP